MKFKGKTIVVTGGASGIGAALLAGFTARGARTCCIDLHAPGDTATPLDLFLPCDVAEEPALRKAISKVISELGEIDIFVSNAGVLSTHAAGDGLGDNADWARCWSVNVMAHVFAARAILPGMQRRGAGHLVTVASAAGLLNQIGDAAYSATKHAAVSFAESLAIAHRSDGIGVTLVCPQYVATPLIGLSDDEAQQTDTLLTADEVATCTIRAIAEGKFLVLPHPEVLGYAKSRARDHDRWITEMAKLRQKAIRTYGDARPARFYRLV